jgi:argininosuccinate lyase
MQLTKLWQTGHTLDERIEAFTVGDDFLVDERFLAYDLTASLAHARMLLAIGVLSEPEFAQAEEGLERIGELFASGAFRIERSEEDCHTAIEGFLTREYGDVGKKIHTGRSRNDQSLTMIRLFLCDALETARTTTADLAAVLGARSADPAPMPGYTHMQRAMPTTIGTWFGSYYQAVSDQATCFEPLRALFDQSPLGSAAGFGIDAFPADRAMTARLMGFSRVQENPMYCGLSRGLFEHDFLGVLGGILLVVARMNNDVLLFTTGEF